MVKDTNRPEVIGGHRWLCGSLHALKDMEDPILISGTDGVGNLLAQIMDRHETVGQELCRHVRHRYFSFGAEPLFFLITLPSAC